MRRHHRNLDVFVRLARWSRLSLTMMTAGATAKLETRLTEVLMGALAPCDLGDGIEVVHDVEDAVEVEMECAVDDEDDEPAPSDTVKMACAHDENAPSEAVGLIRDLLAELSRVADPVQEEELGFTTRFVRESEGTNQFVRFSAPYERIEIQLDPSAFRRATIEEAKTFRSSAFAATRLNQAK